MKTTRFGPTDAGSAPGAAAGPAGGDTGGSFPNPTVTGLDGKPFAAPGTEANADVISYNAATGKWDFGVPASVAPSGPAGGDLAGTYPNPTVTGLHVTWAGGDLSGSGVAPVVARINGTTVTGTPAAAGRFLRSSGTTAAAWSTIQHSDLPALLVSDYPFHDEPLTDGASNIIFAGGDVVVVVGVPNP